MNAAGFERAPSCENFLHVLYNLFRYFVVSIKEIEMQRGEKRTAQWPGRLRGSQKGVDWNTTVFKFLYDYFYILSVD